MSAAACGGGNGGGTALSGTPPATGSITVRTLASSGAPVSGVAVSLNGSFDGRTATADANGEVMFVDVPVGDVSLEAFKSGFYSARKRSVVSAGSVTSTSLILNDVTEAIPVILASRSDASGDAQELTLDIDIAVLNKDGEIRETLTTPDFAFDGVCDWDWCILLEDGRTTGQGYVPRVQNASWNPAPVLVRPTLALAVMLDQSADMNYFDPSGLRLDAITDFLASLAAPDTVAVGSYQGLPGNPLLTIYGGFTSDAASFADAIAGLAGHELGANPLYEAATDMLAFAAANAPAESTGLKRALVVVTSNGTSAECANPATCKPEVDSVIAASSSASIPVVAIGPDVSFAVRTGGISAFVSEPKQYLPVLRSIGAIIGRSVAYQTVRVSLDSGQPGTFLPGRTVKGYLFVRVGPDTILSVPVSTSI